MKFTSLTVMVLGLGLGLTTVGCEYYNVASSPVVADSVVTEGSASEATDTVIQADASRGDSESAIVPEQAEDATREVSENPIRTDAPEWGGVCTGPVEPVDNFAGFVRCQEGYCKDTLAGDRYECPDGRPVGVVSFPADVTCRAWSLLDGHQFLYHCIEGYCFDRHFNGRAECPADSAEF